MTAWPWCAYQLLQQLGTTALAFCCNNACTLFEVQQPPHVNAYNDCKSGTTPYLSFVKDTTPKLGRQYLYKAYCHALLLAAITVLQQSLF